MSYHRFLIVSMLLITNGLGLMWLTYYCQSWTSADEGNSKLIELPKETLQHEKAQVDQQRDHHECGCNDIIYDDQGPHMQWRRNRLAIVIPFVEGQLKHVLKNIELWNVMSPCSTSAKYASLTDLVFVYNKELTLKPEIELSIRAALTAFNEVQRCFSLNYIFISMGLPEAINHHPEGPTEIFYRLIESGDTGKTMGAYEFILLSEPDLRVCRKGWADQAWRETFGATDNFWMKGSGVRYAFSENFITEQGTIARHINGNSFYHIGDVEFRKFVFRLKSLVATSPNALKSDGRVYRAFDVLLWLFLHSLTFEETVRVNHLFVYTNTIQHLVTMPADLSYLAGLNPRTYFFHGKGIILDVIKSI